VLLRIFLKLAGQVSPFEFQAQLFTFLAFEAQEFSRTARAGHFGLSVILCCNRARLGGDFDLRGDAGFLDTIVLAESTLENERDVVRSILD
jgi:hypothetical protein